MTTTKKYMYKLALLTSAVSLYTVTETQSMEVEDVIPKSLKRNHADASPENNNNDDLSLFTTKKQCTTKNHFDNLDFHGVNLLADDLLKLIASYLTMQDLSPFEQTCKQIGKIVRNSHQYHFFVLKFRKNLPGIMTPKSHKDLFLYLKDTNLNFQNTYVTNCLHYFPTLKNENLNVDFLWKNHLSHQKYNELYRLNKISNLTKPLKNLQLTVNDKINEIKLHNFSDDLINQHYTTTINRRINNFNTHASKQNQPAEETWLYRYHEFMEKILPNGKTQNQINVDTLIQDLSNLIRTCTLSDGKESIMLAEAQFAIETLKSQKENNDQNECDRLKTYFRQCKYNKDLLPNTKGAASLRLGQMFAFENNYAEAKDNFLQAYHNPAISPYHKLEAADRLGKLIVLNHPYSSHDEYVQATTYLQEVVNARPAARDFIPSQVNAYYYLGLMAYNGWGQDNNTPDIPKAIGYFTTLVSDHKNTGELYCQALKTLGDIQKNMAPPNHVAAKAFYATFLTAIENLGLRDSHQKDIINIKITLANFIFLMDNVSQGDIDAANLHYQYVIDNNLSSNNQRLSARFGKLEIMRRSPRHVPHTDQQTYDQYVQLMTETSQDRKNPLYLTCLFSSYELIRQHRVKGPENIDLNKIRTTYETLLNPLTRDKLPPRIWGEIKLAIAEMDRTTQLNGCQDARFAYTLLINHEKTPLAQKQVAIFEKAKMDQYFQGVSILDQDEATENALNAYNAIIDNPHADADTRARAFIQVGEMGEADPHDCYREGLNLADSLNIKIEAQLRLYQVTDPKTFERPRSGQISSADYDLFIGSQLVPEDLKWIAHYAKLGFPLSEENRLDKTIMLTRQKTYLDLLSDANTPNHIRQECFFNLGEMNYLGQHIEAPDYDAANLFLKYFVGAKPIDEDLSTLKSFYYLAKIEEKQLDENEIDYQHIVDVYKAVIKEHESTKLISSLIKDDSELRLADIYYCGAGNLNPNYLEANRLYTCMHYRFSLPSELKAVVLFRLAEINYNGWHGPQDITSAQIFYTSCANERNCSEEMKNRAGHRSKEIAQELGVINEKREKTIRSAQSNIEGAVKYYFGGNGILPNYDYTRQYLENIDLNDENLSHHSGKKFKATALFMLGEMNYWGQSMQKNLNAALIYYQELDKMSIYYLANQSYQQIAHYRLGHLWYKDFLNNEGKIDYEKAKACFEFVCGFKIGNNVYSDWAHCYLAEMNYNKTGFRQRIKKTINKHLSQVTVDNDAKIFAGNLKNQLNG